MKGPPLACQVAKLSPSCVRPSHPSHIELTTRNSTRHFFRVREQHESSPFPNPSPPPAPSTPSPPHHTTPPTHTPLPLPPLLPLFQHRMGVNEGNRRGVVEEQLSIPHDPTISHPPTLSNTHTTPSTLPPPTLHASHLILLPLDTALLHSRHSFTRHTRRHGQRTCNPPPLPSPPLLPMQFSFEIFWILQ